MTDKLTPERRSWNMSRIRSRDTGPELTVRRILHRAGLRFRLHRGDLPGRPDIVLPKYRTVVFVHGCFWHSHGCRNSVKPKTNVDFWAGKLAETVRRDTRNRELLAGLGWSVHVIWECRLSDAERLPELLRNAQAQRQAQGRTAA